MRSLLALLHTTLSLARLLHSLPDDPYAFPKFRVAFLTPPILNDTAQRWLSDGLRGGQAEFFDQSSPFRKEIDGVDAVQSQDTSSINVRMYTLEHMKMGPRNSYICLIPEPPDISPSSTPDESDSEVSPARSWSLLQPLTGTCLYHRQGWFTYSYCHNQEIRQFKELLPVNPHHLGAYKPEEDPEWEAYTLGKAPTSPEPGADLTLAEQHAQAANLQLARSAGSRYLVQRWGDGTICDKTGKRREVEVQFHCSMTMADSIIFVKEAKTCSYVLVIHTPRLCGEPGFRSRLESSDETQISCREVVGQANAPLPVTDHPLKSTRPKAVSPPRMDVPSVGEEAKNKVYEELIRKTIEALFGPDSKSRSTESRQIEVLDDGSEFVIELLGDTELFDRQSETVERLLHDVKAEKNSAKAKSSDKEAEEQDRASADDNTSDHDEL
ncbi:hypothetical protein JOM56_003614 [Amanita muscaria]